MAKIMLVEDDPMIAEIYKKKFETAGFEVANAVTGKEVLKLAKEEKFDLILLDMVLPEISGMDVLKELKKSGKYDSNLKVIVFSNLDRSEHEKEARENGADGYIGKTEFNPNELVVEIQRLLKAYGEQNKNRDRLAGTFVNDNGGKKILFIEDVGEYYYNLDRMLIQLKRAGKLNRLAGMVVGQFTDMKDNANPTFGKGVYEIVNEHVSEYDYPVCFDFPVGHVADNRAIGVGMNVFLNVQKEHTELTFISPAMTII